MAGAIWTDDFEVFEKLLITQPPVPKIWQRPADAQLALPGPKFREGWSCPKAVFQRVGERLLPGLGKLLLRACRGTAGGKGKKLPRPDLAVAWYNLAVSHFFERVRGGCLLVTPHNSRAVRWLPSQGYHQGWRWEQSLDAARRCGVTKFELGSLCGDFVRLYLMAEDARFGQYIRITSSDVTQYYLAKNVGPVTGEVSYTILPHGFSQKELVVAEEMCRQLSLGISGNQMVSSEIRRDLLTRLRAGGLTEAFAKRVLSRVVCRGSAETCESVVRRPQDGMVRSVADLCVALTYEAGSCRNPALREKAELLAGTLFLKG